MDLIATQPKDSRKTLFTESSPRIGIPAALVEKDFWVCWALKHLFAMPALQGCVIFKGGTTLSKVYGIIQRFSEDVDLTLDRQLFGIEGDSDPANATSNKERNRRLTAMGKACRAYVQGELRGDIVAKFATVLGDPGKGWELTGDSSDPDGQSLSFRYPAGVALDSSTDYVPPAVKLEFGSRGEAWPTQLESVRPYSADAFPQAFSEPSCEVVALAPERTFWEKATILHQEAHRPASKPMPSRLSRHYYDLAMMAASPVKDKALGNLGLLARVVQHKMDFFRCGWAQYEEAKPGSLRLVPDDRRLKGLAGDYEAMRLMIFGGSATLDWILDKLAELESAINCPGPQNAGGSHQ